MAEAGLEALVGQEAPSLAPLPLSPTAAPDGVVRFVAGSIGTAYMTNRIAARTGAFYSAFASRIEWARMPAESWWRAWTPSRGAEQLPSTTRMPSTARSLLEMLAAGEAFGIAMKHLALVSLAAALIALLAQNIKARGVPMGH